MLERCCFQGLSKNKAQGCLLSSSNVLLVYEVVAFIFQTLENLLISVRKGKKIDEDEIPPPVAAGKSQSSHQLVPTDPAPASQASLPNGCSALSSHLPPQSISAASEQPPLKVPPMPEESPVRPPPVLPKPKISPAPAVPLRSPEAPQERPAPLASSPMLG